MRRHDASVALTRTQGDRSNSTHLPVSFSGAFAPPARPVLTGGPAVRLIRRHGAIATE
jgi:hypothetical protein